MNTSPAGARPTLLVAAQICDPSGVRRTDARALELLRTSASELSDQRAGLLGLPGAVTPDGVLSVVPSSPETVVEILLAIAAATRPERATFCLTVAAGDEVRERPATALDETPSRVLETALLGAHATDAAARAGLADTDHRDLRVRVLGPVDTSALGAALDLLLEAYDAMTNRQRQIVQLVKASRTQQDVATHLGISRQAVNQSLTSARWPRLESAARRITASIAELAGASWDTSGERGGGR